MPKETLKTTIARLAKNRHEGVGGKTVFSEPEGTEPVVTALAILKVGTFYSCAEFTLQGERVLSVDLDEPNSRAIAADCFKIAAQKKILE